MKLKIIITRYLKYLKNFGPRITFYYLLYPRLCRTKAIIKRHEEIKRYLKKEFCEILNRYKTKKQFYTTQNNGQRCIWVCWLQGEENMPELVKICYNSILQHSGKNKVNLITTNNIHEYIDVSPFIQKSVEKGDICLTHYADYLRILLLEKYGGLWIDASILVTNKISIDKDFFTIKNRESNIHYVSKSRWAVSLIGCSTEKGLYMFSCLRELFEAYITKRTFFIDFFLFDYFISIMYEELPDIKECIDRNEYNNENFYSLHSSMNNAYNDIIMHEITNSNTFHKLSWKAEYLTRDKNGNQTFYGYIKSRFIYGKETDC